MRDIVPEFELIEVSSAQSPVEVSTQLEQDEFEFPLFSFAHAEVQESNEDEANKANYDESGNKTELQLTKITLRESPCETFKQERPQSYYFARYSKEELTTFEESAIDYDTIFKDAKIGPIVGWERSSRKTVVDITQCNEEIERAILREERQRRARPSKRQRLGKRLGAERERERETKDKQIKKLLKKKFHKRGGKKNKKSTTSSKMARISPFPK